MRCTAPREAVPLQVGSPASAPISAGFESHHDSSRITNDGASSRNALGPGCPGWTAQQFANAVRTNPVHPVPALGAEGAFIAADPRFTHGRQRAVAAHTACKHFQCHTCSPRVPDQPTSCKRFIGDRKCRRLSDHRQAVARDGVEPPDTDAPMLARSRKGTGHETA